MDIKKGNFRTDINGLRAWAVVSVILYHFGVFGFSGGFVGVDIFFVISGFLMTGIITKGLTGSLNSDKRFSVLEFYISRAKRILPALIVLCLSVLALGWLVLLPQEYHTLGAYVISVLGFFSNIKFSRESGYFDVSSHENLLLHTWSLSVEWQFYVVLPLVMLGAWKLRPKISSLKALIVIGLFLSLYWSVAMTPHKPLIAFYLIKTRAWELLAGGVVFLWANSISMSPVIRKMFEWLGFMLIILSVIIFDQTSQWPGWRALIPVMGAVLVLVAARQGSWWTGTKLTQWLGDSSYSLYLWHWPIAVMMVFLNLKGHLLGVMFGLILTLLLGWFSYRYIEMPVRINLSEKPMFFTMSLMLSGIFVVGALGALVRWQDGFPDRVSLVTHAIFAEALNKNPRLEQCASQASGTSSKDKPVPNCTYGHNGITRAVMIGDSHSSSLVTSFKAAIGNGDVLQWTANACPLAIGIHSSIEKHKCENFLVWVLKEAKKLPNDVPVVLVSRFSLYLYGPNEIDPPLMNLISLFGFDGADFKSEEYPHKMREGVLKMVCELSKDREVYIVRPVPEQGLNVPMSMGRSMMFHVPTRISVSREQYNKRNALALETLDLAAKECGAKILDPVQYLCDEKACWGDADGLPIYFDDDHLNERGSRMLIPMFKTVAEQFSQENL